MSKPFFGHAAESLDLVGETQPRKEQIEALGAAEMNAGVSKVWAMALYQNARDAYQRCVQNERDMRSIVMDTRSAFVRAERACDELRAEAIVNAEDEFSGIFIKAGATNERARKAAIEQWESSDPMYLDLVRKRDECAMEYNCAQRDLTVCARSLAILRHDLEFAIVCMGGNDVRQDR